MKKTVNGLPAFNLMLTTPPPEKTRTYTPILHASIISHARREIGKAGFKIIGEDYRCTSNGQIAIGTYRIDYKEDPDIELMAAFMNSYDTTYAFRFALGASVKASCNSVLMSTDTFGFYKKFHKGDADVLSANNISTILKTADDYWEQLIKVKDKMKKLIINKSSIYKLLGKMFFEEDMLTGYQLNIIKEEIKKCTYDYKVHPDSLWAYFNHITHSLKQSHPSDWISDHQTIFELLDEEYSLTPKPVEEEEEVFALSPQPSFA